MSEEAIVRQWLRVYLTGYLLLQGPFSRIRSSCLEVLIDLFTAHMYHLAACSQRLANYSGRTQPSAWDLIRAVRRIHPLRTIYERQRFTEGLSNVWQTISEAEEKLPLPSLRFPLQPVGGGNPSSQNTHGAREHPQLIYAYSWLPLLPSASVDGDAAASEQEPEETASPTSPPKRQRTTDTTVDGIISEPKRQHNVQQLLKGVSGPFTQIQSIIQDDQSTRDLMELQQHATVATDFTTAADSGAEQTASIDQALQQIDETLEKLIQPQRLRNPPRNAPAVLKPTSATSAVSEKDALENGLYGDDLNDDCRWLSHWLNRTRTHATVPWVLDPEEIQQLEKGVGGNTVHAELEQLKVERTRRLEEIRRRKEAEEAERQRLKREAEEAERRREEEMLRLKEELEANRLRQLQEQQQRQLEGAVEPTEPSAAAVAGTGFIDFSRLSETRISQPVVSGVGVVEEDFEAEMQAEMDESETPTKESQTPLAIPASTPALHQQQQPVITAEHSTTTVQEPGQVASQPPQAAAPPLPKIKIKLSFKKPDA